MKLLTKSLEKQFSKIGSQDSVADPLVIAKFFTPDAHWTWYATEYDPEYQVFFGYVVGDFPEWGSFALSELKAIRGVLNLPVERDSFFTPTKFSKLRLP